MKYSDYKLVAMVQQKPYIYDKSHKLYGNSTAIVKVFAEIAASFNPPLKGEQLYKRYITLRDTFIRKLSDTDLLSKTWPLLEAMKYLKPYVLPQNQQNTERKQFSLTNEKEQCDDDQQSNCSGDDYSEEKFVALVSEHPELYDRQDKNYTNKNRKLEVWSTIGNRFNPKMTADYCVKKYKTVRDRYVRWHRQEGQQQLLQNLNFDKYKHFEFLTPHIKSKSKKDDKINNSVEEILDDESFENTTESIPSMFKIEEVIIKDSYRKDDDNATKISYQIERLQNEDEIDDKPVQANFNSNDNGSNIVTTNMSITSSAHKRKKPNIVEINENLDATKQDKRFKIDEALIVGINTFKNFFEKQMELDEDDYFGLGIVKMLKKLPQSDKNAAKIKIQTYLSDLQLKPDCQLN